MNRLIIWDKETEVFLKDFGNTKSLTFYLKEIENKKKNRTISVKKEIPLFSDNVSVLISNEEEFIKLCNFNKIVVNELIILVELGWKEHYLQEFYGYTVLKVLMEKDLIKPPLHIFFVSTLERETIYSMAKDKNHFFVTVFPHIKINHNGKITVPDKPQFPQNKFKFLRKYILTETGILDVILHDISNLSDINDNTIVDKTNEIVKRIFKIQSIVGDQIFVLCTKFKNYSKTNVLCTDFIKELNVLIRNRIKEFLPDKIKNNNSSKKIKHKVLLLEDDESTLKNTKESLEQFFQVSDFTSAEEAIEELKQGGQFYRALICDMVLLESPKKIFYQNIQGIEVLEYASEHFPHIAQRVITGIPRKGILELLPEMTNKDLLHKTLILKFGINDFVLDFVKELERDIKIRHVLLKQRGPSNAFWNDYSIKNQKGGRFKRFYYEFAITDQNAFNEMWKEIYQIVESCKNNDASIKINATFGKIENAKDITETSDKEKKETFLKKILTHRLLIISRYKNNSTFCYKDDYKKNESYFHLNYWESELPVNPKQYFYFVGFGLKNLKPDPPNRDTEIINFDLNYNQLFDKEIDWLKDNRAPESITTFYLSNEIFCKTINTILELIIEEKKLYKTRCKFKKQYPAQPENVFDIDEDFGLTILSTISQENKISNPNDHCGKVWTELNNFATKNSNPSGTEEDSEEYSRLSNDIKVLIRKIIMNF